MSISMNNHETRITALENRSSGIWVKGETTTGVWYKESGSGLLIQHSKDRVTNWGQITLPQAYSSSTSYSVVATYGRSEFTQWTPADSTTTCNIVSKSAIHVWSGERSQFSWITIGYLITNRLLTYIREVIL